MQCDHARDLLGAFVDGELTMPERRAVAEHLASCPSCAREVKNLKEIGQQLRAAGREIVPTSFAVRLRGELAREAASMPQTQVQKVPSLSASMMRRAATLVAACAATALLTWTAATWSNTMQRLEFDVVSAHVRSLLQDSPIQVASSDSHTVKPWFAGRIDFSPEVKDFTAEGFPLVGGRIDYVGARRVGAVVYKRQMHIVNVFMWPGAGQPKVSQYSMNGYNILTWTKSGVVFWAVSDLNAAELGQLQNLL